MKAYLLLAIAAAIFITVGTMDYNDHSDAADIYRLEVCAGIAHNWKGVELECPKIQAQPRWPLDG